MHGLATLRWRDSGRSAVARWVFGGTIIPRVARRRLGHCLQAVALGKFYEVGWLLGWSSPLGQFAIDWLHNAVCRWCRPRGRNCSSLQGCARCTTLQLGSLRARRQSHSSRGTIHSSQALSHQREYGAIAFSQLLACAFGLSLYVLGDVGIVGRNFHRLVLQRG